ncbi:pheromone A receptor-domain-containing protein [Dichomitus squalens]|uniref:Pheromone A receptor-domain-containing protein n=1 Tax=Dichomitus squalens TaxID=114155 RepID=A0A4V2K0P2_9APHY|nr:pheromone A receptor-domain-containing protein [Dichomitus squalens]
MSPIPQAFASFLAATVVLIPLPSHSRARNVPTISLIVWLFVLNVAHGVNVIVWWDNLELRLLIWCDVVSKLVIGANMALPAACFCLAMRLEGIAAVRHAKSSSSDKRRRMLVDTAICFGIPVVYMALHYVVQGHRFDIIEDFGCQPESYVSLPEFFLVWLIPILSCLGTFVFGGLAFMHFFRRRATFARHLAASNSGLTPSRYFRLMTMSLALVIWDLVVFALTLSFNYRNGLRPWTSWADVHSNWLNVNRFPIVLVPASDKRWLYFIWWTIPVTAYMFFAFFAFSNDVSSQFYACLWWLRRHILRYDPDRKTTIPIGSPDKTSFASSYPPMSPTAAFTTSKDVYPDPPLSAPLSPTSIDYSRLSWPDTPSTSVSTHTLPSVFFGSKDAEVMLHLSSPSDDPSPPYVPPGATTPISSTAIVPPPLAHSSGGRHVYAIAHALTDQIV